MASPVVDSNRIERDRRHVLQFRRTAGARVDTTHTATCRGLVYTIDDERAGTWNTFVYRANHEDPDPIILGQLPSFDDAVDLCNRHASGHL